MGSTVKESDARAAYNALIDFTQVVKANPITPSTPASSVSGSAASSITADHFGEQVVVLEGLASLHCLHDGGVHVELAVGEDLVVDGVGLLPRLLLLSGVD